MAPEIIGNDPYSYSADVWSALCVIISSTTFMKCNPVHIPTSALCEKIKTHTDSKDIITLIEYLHKINHLERPSSKKALELILQLKEKHRNIEKYPLLPEITPHISPSNTKKKRNIIIRTSHDEMSIRLPTRPASSGVLYSKSNGFKFK
jgi:serine/threonine protein kinase